MSKRMNHPLGRRHVDALQKSSDAAVYVSVGNLPAGTSLKEESLPVRAIMIKLPYRLSEFKRHRNHSALIPLALDGNKEVIEIYIVDSDGECLIDTNAGVQEQQTKGERTYPRCSCHDDGPYCVC